jgi:hypothetical protein
MGNRIIALGHFVKFQKPKIKLASMGIPGSKMEVLYHIRPLIAGRA